MIDAKTLSAAIKFVSILNELAEMSEHGIHPFSKCHPENRDDWDGGILYLDAGSQGPIGMAKNDIIADCLVDSEHHDAISSYADVFSSLCGYPVTCRIVPPDHPDESTYVDIRNDAFDLDIVIENGAWYTV